MDSTRRLPNHRIKEIQFGVYTTDEVKALSVVPVTNPQCVDLLGHAVASGPHDPRMGAADRSSKCPTCYESSRTCPGHMGHISLPLPLFNPMFFKTVMQILKGSCFTCKSINCDPDKVPVLLQQMKALDWGSLTVAMDLASYAQNYMANHPVVQLMDEKVQLDDNLKQMMETLLDAENGGSSRAVDVGTQSREERKKLLTEFMHYQWKKNRSCLVCMDKNWRVSANPYVNKVMYKFGGVGKDDDKPKKRTPAKKSAISSGRGKKGSTAKQTSKTDSAEKETEETKGGEETIADQEDNPTDLSNDPRAVRFSPVDARKFLRDVFVKNEELLRRMFGLLDNKMEHPTDVFFIESLLVGPTRFRPERVMGDSRFAHVATKNLERILIGCNNIRILRKLILDGEDVKKVAGYIGLERLPGKTLEAKLHEACALLQTAVNVIADGDTDRLNAEFATGIKQVLEKKEGLFRMHMMGKRVNYSARSVISPDPYINLNEIGVPMVFAMRLTYPVFVSTNNLDEMRRAVINGPEVYPGAMFIEYEDGTTVKLSKDSKNQREAEAKSLITESSRRGGGAKKVYRHLINGDIMLLNRQPTLHKTSIMAHKARILPSEKTLRLHYANCKSYNADFDGDEMNAHLPQDEVARSEAYNIVNASYQYLVAKDGTPLSGLIQDHIVAGVHLTIRGKFFVKPDYEQLVYSAIGDIATRPVNFLPPSILKPQQLWSGKQIISTIVINLIPPQFAPVSLRTGSKVPVKNWCREPVNLARKRYKKRYVPFIPQGMNMTESDVIFRQGELLCGVLDKAQFGPSSYGLVHACFELYGGEISALLLSGLARLFTVFLQIHGFSLGVEDILISAAADAARREIMDTVEASGESVVVEAFNLTGSVTSEVMRDRIEKAHRSVDQADMQILDAMTERKVNEFNSAITDACVPFGLYKRFPENHLQTMVLSGAKGAQVNCIQMSCLLGQITLEGTRPPLMLSGRTLPSFAPYEATPRSGGFVMQRFGTGLRPQEYFFHCMAGREGLIDTAVKTSRSGYLQRCIIKHLEGVMVNYDMTVRDSDATVIQFLYGEDGLDIGRLPFYTEKQLPFLMANANKEVEEEICQLKSMIGTSDEESGPALRDHEIAEWRRKLLKLEKRLLAKRAVKNAQSHDTSDFLDLRPPAEVALHRLELGKVTRIQGVQHSIEDPTISRFRPDLSFGSISERMQQVMAQYRANPPLDAIKGSDAYKCGKSMDDIIQDQIAFKYVKSLCHPGEAVGALAAQSIGEPSTQMTLNTFHFAGRGEMNVTLGIPRLREILMTASKTIKTPTMEVPVRIGMENEAEIFRIKLNKIMFDEVVEYFDISTRLEVQEEDKVANVLQLFVKLIPSADITAKTCLNSAKILNHFEKTLAKRLIDTFKVTISLKKMVKSGKRAKNEDDADGEAVEAGGGDEDGDDDRGNRRGAAVKADDHEDAESVNSDGEDADPDAAKAQFAAEGDYAGDVDDTEIEHEFDLEQEANMEGDELMEDKENSVMGDSNSDLGDVLDKLLLDTPGKLVASSSKRLDRTPKATMNAMRVEYVCALDPWIKDYKYDPENNSWCRLTFAIPVTNSVLDPQSLIETELKRSVLYQAPYIKKGFLSKDKRGQLILKTEGVNFDYLLRHDDILEVEKLFSNDIQAVAGRFGIEAAAKTIVRQCNEVFGAYGIDVNYRHLSLISDYMSVNGSVRAFNRMALTTNASPFQKMSFETSMNFYKDAVLTGATDNIKSPSAQLVVGERLNIGTGIFSLRQPALRGN